MLLPLSFWAQADTRLDTCRSLRHSEPQRALQACEAAALSTEAEVAFEAAMHVADLASQLGEPSRARAALEGAVGRLGEVADPLAAHRLGRRRGLLAYREGRSLEALPRFLEALAIARGSADAQAMAASENDLGVVYRHLGNHAAALGHFEASLRLREAAGQDDLGALLANIGALYLELDDGARAGDYLQRAREAHRAQGRTLLAFRTQEDLARLAQRRGDLARARALLDEAWSHYRDSDTPRDQLRLSLLRAELEAGASDGEAAARWLQGARGLATEPGGDEQLQVEWLQAGLALRSGARAALASADAALSRARTDAGEAAAELQLRALARQAELAEALGQTQQALNLLKQQHERELALEASRHGQRFDELRIRFEVERLEVERDRLAAESARRKSELERGRLQTLIVAGAGLLGLLLLALWMRSRQRAQRRELELRVRESRTAAEALRSDLRSMAGLLDRQGSAALVFDAAGRVRAASAAAAELLGHRREALQGRELGELLGADAAQWAQGLIEADSLDSGEPGGELGTLSLAAGGGRIELRCERLALEEELGVLGLQGLQAEPAAAPASVIHEPGEQREQFRRQLVALMQLSLEAWERATRRNRIDLAQASGIWRITVDDGRLRVRAMDRYLGLDSLPERPRWREVLRTAYYVLAEVPLDSAHRRALESGVESLLQLSREAA